MIFVFWYFSRNSVGLHPLRLRNSRLKLLRLLNPKLQHISLTTEAKYMEQYPGDDIIDIMGISLYCDAPQGDTIQVANYASLLDKQLTMLASLGKQHDKPIALTETGYNGIKTDNWWTYTLANILDKHPISYVLLWHNASPESYYVPYPGHHSTSDFVRFYNLPATLFRQDINGPYNSREY